MAEVLFYVGVLQLTVVFLSIAAGFISISMFKMSKQHEILAAWRTLMWVLIFFAFEEIIGILDAFNIYRQINWMRHVVPSFIMLLLMMAVIKQIQINKARS